MPKKSAQELRGGRDVHLSYERNIQNARLPITLSASAATTGPLSAITGLQNSLTPASPRPAMGRLSSAKNEKGRQQVG